MVQKSYVPKNKQESATFLTSQTIISPAQNNSSTNELYRMRSKQEYDYEKDKPKLYST